MKHGYPWALALSLGILLSIPWVAGGSNSVEYLWVQGDYDLYLTHAHVRETLGIRFTNDTYLLAGQALAHLQKLTNVSLYSDDRSVEWTQNGTVLHWSYDPPLSGGDTITLTREWDVLTEKDREGFRTLRSFGAETTDSQLHIRTHDVDIIDSSLPLTSGGLYSGNLSGQNYITYSSSYKLYHYTWEGVLRNMGPSASEVCLNISIPRDGGFQQVVAGPGGNIVEDQLGNAEMTVKLNLTPESSENLTIEFSVVTETWKPDANPGLFLPGNPSNYLSSDDRYWQSEDPGIVNFAASATNGTTEGISMVRALSSAIENHLEYTITRERKGALWALLNRKGSCMEYSDLFIACARSLGIPSLYVSGACGSGKSGGRGHAWVVAWIPEAGWIGVDPIWPHAMSLDSGRVAIRLCNPDDLGVIMEYIGGNASIQSWRETWHFEELTRSEAEKLFGIGEWSMSALPSFLVLFGVARISIRGSRTGPT